MSPREPDSSFGFHHEDSASSLVLHDAKVETLSSSEERESPRKSVSFQSVQVREFNRIVGDHPDVRVGPPISIGWDYTEQQARSIEDYETSKPAQKRNLRMSSITRKNLLANVFGIPEEEIRAAEKEVQRIKKQRESSNKQGKAGAKVEAAMQSAKRKIRRTFLRDSFMRGLSAASTNLMPLSVYG